MLVIKQKQLERLRWLRWAARSLALCPGFTILMLFWGWMLIGAPGHHTDEQEWGIIAFYLFVVYTGIGIALMLIGAIAWRWPVVGGSIFLCMGIAICWVTVLDCEWVTTAGGLVLFASGLINLTVWEKERIIRRRWNQ